MFNYIGKITLQSTLLSVIMLFGLYIFCSFAASGQNAGGPMAATFVLYMMASPFIIPACMLYTAMKD